MYENYQLKIDESALEELINKAFMKNGILEGTTADEPPKNNKMLWGRITLFSPKIVEHFRFLTAFYKKICFGIFCSIVVLWMLYICITISNQEIINKFFSLNVKDIVLCYLFIFLAGLVHEFGHSAALMSYNGKPGRIGIAVYFIMPVLFSNVSSAWKLKRSQRTLIDLGGMYLQGVFLVFVYLVNTITFKNNIIYIGVTDVRISDIGKFKSIYKVRWLLGFS